MTWDSGACEPGLEGTELDPATWKGKDAAELRQLAARFEDLLAQLRAGQAAETGDELARVRARRTGHVCAHCIGYRPHGPSMCPCNPDRRQPT